MCACKLKLKGFSLPSNTSYFTGIVSVAMAAILPNCCHYKYVSSSALTNVHCSGAGGYASRRCGVLQLWGILWAQPTP